MGNGSLKLKMAQNQAELQSLELPPEFPDQLRIVLIGKTGVGKSSLGNSLINDIKFNSNASPRSVTETCESGETNVQISGRNINIKILDTPGLFDSHKTQNQTLDELLKCIAESLPGPHVFIIVMSLGSRFSQEEREVLDICMKNFGKELENYGMVVFTGSERLEGRTLEDWIEECPALTEYMAQYNKRYCAINNKDIHGKQRDRVAIFDLIIKLVTSNEFKYYDEGMYKTARQIYDKEIEDEKKKLEEEFERKLEKAKKQWREEVNFEEEVEKRIADREQYLNEKIVSLKTENDRLKRAGAQQQINNDESSPDDGMDKEMLDENSQKLNKLLHYIRLIIEQNSRPQDQLRNIQQHLIDSTPSQSSQTSSSTRQQNDGHVLEIIQQLKDIIGDSGIEPDIVLKNLRERISIIEKQFTKYILSSGTIQTASTNSGIIQIPLINTALEASRELATTIPNLKRQHGQMPEPGYSRIRSNYQQLISDLDPDSLTNSLFSKGVFDEYDLEMIKQKQPDGRKKMNEELLNRLLMSGNTYHLFLQSLKETGHDLSVKYLTGDISKSEKKAITSQQAPSQDDQPYARKPELIVSFPDEGGWGDDTSDDRDISDNRVNSDYISDYIDNSDDSDMSDNSVMRHIGDISDNSNISDKIHISDFTDDSD